MAKDRNELIQDLDRINSWIGNCDQKSSFLLTMVGVMATIICTSDLAKVVKDVLVTPFVAYWRNDLGGFNWLNCLIALSLILGLGCLFSAIVFALLSLKAKTDYDEERKKQEGMEEKSLLHYGSIAKMTYKDYALAENDMDNDLRSQIFTNSKICDKKFSRYKRALLLTLISMPLLAVAFILLLFV